MFILNTILQVLLTVALYLVIGIIIYKKLLKGKKKKEISKKEAKTVVFDVSDVKEDEIGAAVEINSKISYYEVLQGLKSLTTDKDVKKIIIDVDKLNLPLAKWEELSEIFDEIRKSKELVAIGTFFDERKYRYAMVASKVFMLNTRQSTVCFRGYEYKEPYWKSFLAKFGIKMNILHIGDYKVAGENYSHDKMSPEKKQSILNIKESLFRNFIKSVENKRGVNIENEILNGDFIFVGTDKALESKLIDGVADYEEIGINYKEDTVSFEDYLSIYKEKKNKSKDTIAIINLEGIIEPKKSNKVNITYKNVCEKLDKLEDIKNLKGLVLRINSPGGSALESEKIHQKLKKLDVPIYISMGDVCASGGYYIASAGKKIFADSMTLTGSIGVVLMYPELSETLNKIDVNIEGFEKGKGFDIFNIFETLSEESKEKIIHTMNEVYSEFKSHVIAARGMSEKELEKIAGGRVWLGSEAVNINLIDEIGSLEKSVETMAKDLKLDKYKVENLKLKKSLKETLTSIKTPLISEELEDKIRFMQNNVNQILYYENDFEL